MQLKLLPESIESLAFEAAPHRSEGLHLSQIIKSICVEIDPKRFKSESERLPWERFESGFTFERVLEHAFAARREGIFRPGEVEKDGVIMSPDGIDPADWRLEEYKFTMMSSREAPQHMKFVHWFWQMKAYALALETTRARLRAMFLNGDYRGSGPQYFAWDVEFTEQELHENWAMLIQHARHKGWL